MGWTVNSISDEGPVHWNIAMKFLIPAKFDVSRAIELYRTHEVRSGEEDNPLPLKKILHLESSKS